MGSDQPDFSNDDLGRQKFADLLVRYTTNISKAEVLPAGRVIAVDSPWGSGKTWVATRLPAHFNSHAQIGACVYIDAFQYDYHQDPFALIASAIIEEFKDRSPEVKGLIEAAAGVLRSSLPGIGKGLLKIGGKALGVDANDISTAIHEIATDASDKAIDQLLTTYSATKSSTSAFKKRLEDLSSTLTARGPLVVIIDELDRCRPSFALELLERVKHLFDVTNVVFIFFLHTSALHSAIKNTYGHEIDAHQYLRKFFTLTLGLPTADKPTLDKNARTHFLSKFIDATYPKSDHSGDDDFRDALTQFAPSFNASLRDIENVMLGWQLVGGASNFSSTEAAYGLLLRVIDPNHFAQLRARNLDSYGFEIARLGPKERNEGGHIEWMRDVFMFGPNVPPIPTAVTTQQDMQKAREYKSSLSEFHRVLDRLVLEHVRMN